MNKNPWLVFVVCLAAILPHSGLAQDYHDSGEREDPNKPYGEGSHASAEVPPGMELINIGGIRMIVPQGTKIEKKGSLLAMEGVDEFVARNLKEMSARLEKMEANQNDLRKTVDDLKREISDLRKK